MVRSWGQRDFALADERDWGEIRRSFEHEALVPSTQRTAPVGSRLPNAGVAKWQTQGT